MNKIDIGHEGHEVVIKIEGAEARLHPAEAAAVSALLHNATVQALANVPDEFMPETPGDADEE